jgi:MEMO1 family protein
MQPNLRPKLRSHLQKIRDPSDPHHGYVVDGLRQCSEPLRLPLQEYLWLDWLDGQRTLGEVQTALTRQYGGHALPIERFFDLTRLLDESLLLDGPRWQARLEAPIREPVCIGCYEGDPRGLQRQVEELFTRPAGPGLPKSPQTDDGFVGAIVPHMDYARGNVTYPWGFKEVFERTGASLFVIIGTSHYSGHRFSLTRKHFKTPLGVVETDQDFIDRLVGRFGNGLFDDELQAHLPEHSIELEVVFLQWYYARRRPIRIVPIVVGSFHDATVTGTAPSRLADISRLVEALRLAADETKEPICWLISGDLAHIGPKFQRGRAPVTATELAHSRKQDQALLDCLENGDLAGYFRVLVAEQDERAICGFPPTWTVLSAARPARGKLLHYGRYVHPTGFESVSFASLGLYR